MTLPLSKVNTSRGAPMGRGDTVTAGAIVTADDGSISYAPYTEDPLLFYVEYLPLDAYGYDKGGAYWGLRQPEEITREYKSIHTEGKAYKRTFRSTPRIYRCYVKDSTKTAALIELFIEAHSRAEAKEEIRKGYPQARFYR
jgi:hypothetical protein